jgi:TetR/AcrR family transcriptional regulator, lmrAB and yxaGH operons repressor
LHRLPNDLYRIDMALLKVSNGEVAENLALVFRQLGYEGASLALIAGATGLEKASLYHRFPGGKEEMLSAALGHVQAKFIEKVLEPLGAAGEPAERLKSAQQGLREFYRNGNLPCVLDTLSLQPARDHTADALRQAYGAWLEAMAELARDAGASAAEARRRAQRAIVLIEGALVVARVTGEEKPFRQAVASLPEVLLKGGE